MLQRPDVVLWFNSDHLRVIVNNNLNYKVQDLDTQFTFKIKIL